MIRTMFLTILVLHLAGGCASEIEYTGKTREDIILLLEEKQRATGGEIFIQIKSRNSLSCHRFATSNEIRKDPFVMKNGSWDILPRKKFLHHGDYCTRLFFENDVVVSVEQDVGNGFGGPLNLALLDFFSLYYSVFGEPE